LRLPKGVLVMMKEAARHLLKHPIVGVAAAARTKDGRWILIRRTDTGEWALPGGTLDWGETLRTALARELLEEAGVERVTIKRVAGIFSGVDRDPRFHAVTIVVECEADEPTREPVNPVEIGGVGLFADDEVPALAMGMNDMIACVRSGEFVLE
jgi:8-oxo-dGTP diphosphatase